MPIVTASRIDWLTVTLKIYTEVKQCYSPGNRTRCAIFAGTLEHKLDWLAHEKRTKTAVPSCQPWKTGSN